MHSIAVEFCLSVCLSVCQMHALWQNEIIVFYYLNAIQYRGICNLSTPMGIAENYPLPPEIFAEMTHPLRKMPISQISACNISFVRDSEKKFNYREYKVDHELSNEL